MKIRIEYIDPNGKKQRRDYRMGLSESEIDAILFIRKALAFIYDEPVRFKVIDEPEKP